MPPVEINEQGDVPPAPSEGYHKPLALWVSPVSNLAGVARHILDVARVGLPGWDIVVACPAGPLADELRALGIDVHEFDVEQRVPRIVADLRHIIRDVDPALVHSHLAKADFLVAMAAPRGVTLVSTEHHIQADQRVFHGSALKAILRVAAHRTRLRRFDRLIAVSESTRRDMMRHWKPHAPISVIRNGVERGKIVEPSPGLRLLSLTRLSPEKNLTTTLRAFAAVQARRPEATLTLAGQGQQETELRALANELGIKDAVDFAGFMDAGSALRTHDVLLQPSRADNLSYTLLDAVAHGLGVAASDIGGNGEILPARCLAAADDVDKLAEIVLEQGSVIDSRPSLPTSIPTPQEMAAAVTAVYAKLPGSLASARPDQSPSAYPQPLTFAANQGDVGGGEVMLLAMAEAAREAGRNVLVVGPQTPGAVLDEAQVRGFDTVAISSPSAAAYLRNLRTWDRSERSGTLWCNGLRPAAATSGHADRIVHLHQIPDGPAQRLAARLAALRARAVVVPSAFMQEFVPGSRVLSNWTDAEPASAGKLVPPTPPFVVGYLGRLSVAKGVVTLCDAVETLRHRGLDVHLLVAGESRFVPDKEAKAVEAALARLGEHADRRGWMDRSAFFDEIDVAAFPSKCREAFGLVAAEAMAARCPFVVSDAGGLPEVAGAGYPFSFPAGDADTLADALERLLTAPRPDIVEDEYVRWQGLYSPQAGFQRFNALLDELEKGEVSQ